MLEAGEDPLFVARRIVILAAEDIGLADPQALSVAVAAQQAVSFIGMPEGFLPLGSRALPRHGPEEQLSAHRLHRRQGERSRRRRTARATAPAQRRHRPRPRPGPWQGLPLRPRLPRPSSRAAPPARRARRTALLQAGHAGLRGRGRQAPRIMGQNPATARRSPTSGCPGRPSEGGPYTTRRQAPAAVAPRPPLGWDARSGALRARRPGGPIRRSSAPAPAHC